MSSSGIRGRRGVEEEESYFISMADMMVGLVFIFIILLIYFAIQYQQKSKALSDAGETRAQMLIDLRDEIKRRNPRLQVTIDTQTGVLRMPAEILFGKSETELSALGKGSVITVAEALAAVLPCYTYPRREANCRSTPHGLDAIFIEGHTDSDPLQGNGILKGNLELSALRATNTFRAMSETVTGLAALQNRDGRPVLSVSGYGESRPINKGEDEAAKGLNRRIDLRFLMETPKDSDLINILVAKP